MIGPFRTAEEAPTGRRREATFEPHGIEKDSIHPHDETAYDLTVRPVPLGRSQLSVRSGPNGVRFWWKDHRTAKVIMALLGRRLEARSVSFVTNDHSLTWQDIDMLAAQEALPDQRVSGIELSIEVDQPRSDGRRVRQTHLVDRQDHLMKVKRRTDHELQFRSNIGRPFHFDVMQFRGASVELVGEQFIAQPRYQRVNLEGFAPFPIIVAQWARSREDGRPRIGYGVFVEPNGDQADLDSALIQKIHENLSKREMASLWAWWPYEFRRYIIGAIHDGYNAIDKPQIDALLNTRTFTAGAKIQMLHRRKVLDRFGRRLGREKFTSSDYGGLAHLALGVLAGRDATSPVFEPGAVVGDFKIIERIGDGGTSHVYEADALEPTAGHPDQVVIKVLRIEHRKNADFLERWDRERQLLQELTNLDHPHLVRLFDVMDQPPAFVMQRIQGETLFDVMRNLDQPPDWRTIRLFLPLIDAIRFLHERSEPIIHRDIKPENIMITGYPDAARPFLLDLGIATVRRWQETKRLTQVRVGTPGYMSPEQISGGRVDQRTDIYALGIVLTEYLTKAPADTIPPVREHLEAVKAPEELIKCLEAMTADDQHKRIATCQDVYDRLVQILVTNNE